MTLSEAKKKSVCRICGEPIKLLAPIHVFDRYETLEWPERVTLKCGKEFAHTECVEIVASGEEAANEMDRVSRELTPMVWKYFSIMQIREAREHAKTSGPAVHHTGFPFRQYKFTAHLFAANTQVLIDAIQLVGANPKWIQYPNTQREHFDLMGAPLEKAMALCGRLGFDPTAPKPVDLFA